MNAAGPALFFLFGITAGVHAQTFTEKAKLFPGDRKENTEFGYSTSLNGQQLAVGGNGFVYVFERNSSGEWLEIQKIVNHEPVIQENFGHSVFIIEKYLLIGSYTRDEHSPSGALIENLGAVYLYKKSESGTWLFHQKLMASDGTEWDQFGSALTLSGNTLVIGTYTEDTDEKNENAMHAAGAVYIFRLNDSGVWSEIKKLVPSDRSEVDYFGVSVSLHGNTLLVGASADDGPYSNPYNGSVYFYEYDDLTEEWNERQKITAPLSVKYGFGQDVELDGNYAIVGNEGLYNESAHLLEKDQSGQWSIVQEIIASDNDGLTHLFGGGVSLSGNYAIVSAPSHNNNSEGAAYVFRRDPSGIWKEIQRIKSSDVSTGDMFGNSVGISGNLVVASALSETEGEPGSVSYNRSGAAYIFEAPGIGTKPGSEGQKLQCVQSDITYTIPNVITPNGDNYNDLLFIADLQLKTTIRVLNRYGYAVFKNQDYQNDWGGENLASGIYYYRITQELENCYTEWNGWLHILK
jgi:gliding motility-associated-like protein